MWVKAAYGDRAADIWRALAPAANASLPLCSDSTFSALAVTYREALSETAQPTSTPRYSSSPDSSPTTGLSGLERL